MAIGREARKLGSLEARKLEGREAGRLGSATQV